jgi:RNA polymerase sigma factor (sigma-70 family)
VLLLSTCLFSAAAKSFFQVYADRRVGDGFPRSGGGFGFPTTRRSAVRGAASSDAAERERSWTALLNGYWRPAYKHLRVKWKLGREEAEDTVQSFFARAVEKDFFKGYQPERARFRTFLKLCLDRHHANERTAQARQKRAAPALDFASAEAELDRAGAAAFEHPDECFDREWRRHVFARAVEALEAWCRSEGKPQVFEAFRRYDLCEPPRPRYEDLAAALGLPVTTITNHLALARRQLRQQVLEQLAELTATERELAEEASLFGLGV